MNEKTNEIFKMCLEKGLTPKCIYCNHSDPEDFLQITCTKNPKYKDKIIDIDDNFFKTSCEFFETDEISIICMMEEAK